MVTTTDDRAEVFSRPAAQINEDGELVVRASAALGCRRALWYAATGYQPTNPPSDDSLTAMEAGNALEPVVVRAMERAGWKVNAADSQDPEAVTMRLGPNLLVTGHPDGTVQMPRVSSTGQALDEDEAGSPGPDAAVRGRGPGLRRRDGRRDQDAGAGGVPPVADAGGRAQPPPVGGPGRLLHLREVRRMAPRRGGRHDGHRQPHLGLRVDSHRPDGAGLGRRLRMAR